MKTDNSLVAKSGEARETRAEKAIRLLTTTTTNPFHQKLGDFRPFYPAVLAAKENGMKAKQIIKILAEGGLKVYPALLEKLMVGMKDDLTVARCHECGHATHMSSVESPVPTENTSSDSEGA